VTYLTTFPYAGLSTSSVPALDLVDRCRKKLTQIDFSISSTANQLLSAFKLVYLSKRLGREAILYVVLSLRLHCLDKFELTLLFLISSSLPHHVSSLTHSMSIDLISSRITTKANMLDSPTSTISITFPREPESAFPTGGPSRRSTLLVRLKWKN